MTDKIKSRMPHFMPASSGTGRVEIGATPTAWLPVAKQATAYVNRISDRGDLVVALGPNAAKVVGTAYFMQLTSEIVLNTETLAKGLKPTHIDLTDAKSQLKAAMMMGALTHEAAHARFSTATPLQLAKAGLSKREIDVITVLEESRIERQILRVIGSHASKRVRLYLRRMTTELLYEDFKVAETPYGASMGAALTLARVDSGSVSRSQGAVYKAALSERLTAVQLRGLRVLWQEFQNLHTGEFSEESDKLHVTYPLATARRIAQDWIALVVDPDADEDDGADLATGGEGPGESSESGSGGPESPADKSENKGEGDDTGKGEGESLGDKLGQIGREDGVDAETDIADEIKDEVVAEKIRDAATDSERRAEAKGEAKKTFRKEHSVTHGASSANGSELVERRVPGGDHRAAATMLARELAKITTHDRTATYLTSVIPPGRVRGRAAVMGSAQLANGQMMTARPFGSTRRKHVETDKVKIAVLSDISGSMAAAMEPLAATNFVIANAAEKIQAEFCSVLFGANVLSMVMPGERVTTLNVMDAGDGMEAVKPALLAADGALDLLDSTGARVLILNTDAHFVSADHRNFAKDFIRLAISRGVSVLWCSYGGFTTVHGGGVHLDLQGMTPAQVATTLGREIVKTVKASQGAVRV